MRTIDQLLGTIPDDLLPGDIQTIIDWMRKDREENAGIKLKKDTGPKTTITLEELGLTKPKPKVEFKRRV